MQFKLFVITAVLLALVLQTEASAQSTAKNASAALASVEARTSNKGEFSGYDGVVEAVRQTVMAAQVAGVIVELRVKVGESVKAGQVLARIDARAADQSASASQAQVEAARASLEVASKDFERQKLLLQKRFISQAALDQAEAVYKAASARVAAQIAESGAVRTQSDFFVLRAPYSGVVADVPIVLGDMALPGRPILTLYDPAFMRVTATIPQTATQSSAVTKDAKIELPGANGAQKWIVPTLVTLLPTADPNTHTMQIRLDLPASAPNVVPGLFARAWLPAQGAGSADMGRVFVPAKAIVRHAELTAVYVLDATAKPLLRQVRLGRIADDWIEVLSGVAPGERVAVDPQAAARVR